MAAPRPDPTRTAPTGEPSKVPGPSGSNSKDGEVPGGEKKHPKQMTKAERRAIQEAQRAAKAAAQAGGPTDKEKGASKGKAASRAYPGAPPPSGGSRREGGETHTHTRARSETISRAEQAQTDAGARGLRIFQHFGLPRAPSIVRGEIHPAIVRLGLQFSRFVITGANARCIATLTAFKTVIEDYSTPQSTTLSRHLMTHLNPQINHLVSARPMAVTMGNAIRQLKFEISNSDIDLPEQDAKEMLCQKIDNYIRDRIIFADQVIQENAAEKIKDGDVILTYARSSVVEKVLLHAHESGKQISVIVVDSRPMLEGKHLLSVLAAAGVPCTYLLLPAVGHALPRVSTVLLGAHSLHANGAVYARAGSALVAMLAKQHRIPVLVCCETYKFTEGVVLDSFTKNELVPPGVAQNNFPSVIPREALTTVPRPNLEILNPLYDLTPPANITAVVTEVGIVPPNSISSIPTTLGHQTVTA